MTKGILSFTFEYEAYAKGDPGFVELQIYFGFNASTPEAGRFGAPENYDPGSGFEVWMDRAEMEVERDGEKAWQVLNPGEFLEVQCERYLMSRDEDDLVQGLPCRDPDDMPSNRREDY